MKIYIDADGCPVVRNTLKIVGKFNIPCVIICDTAHRIEHENAETIVVDKGVDSVDFRLVNLIQKGDIAITQDYGLTAMCLSKQAVVLNQDGKNTLMTIFRDYWNFVPFQRKYDRAAED